MATGVVVAPKIVPKQVLPKEVIAAKLKAEIFGLRFARIENKYHIGRRLWQLQRLHGKAGHGTFLDDLDELDIPHTTGYRWIDFYKRVQLGFDPTPARMTKTQRQKLQELLDTSTEGPAPEKSEEQTADENRAQLAEAIATAQKQIEQAKKKHKGKSGGFSVKFIFTETERTTVKRIYKAVGIEKASEIYYEAMKHAEPNRPNFTHTNHQHHDRRGSVGTKKPEVRAHARRQTAARHSDLAAHRGIN
jgi:hypothetical protein